MKAKLGKKEYIPTPPETRARLDKAWYFKPDIGSHYDIRDVDSEDEPDSVAPRFMCGIGKKGCILM